MKKDMELVAVKDLPKNHPVKDLLKHQKIREEKSGPWLRGSGETRKRTLFENSPQ